MINYSQAWFFVDKKKQTLCFLTTLQLFQTWFKHLVASRRRGDTYYLQNTLLHREAAGWSAKGCDISSGKYMKAQDSRTVQLEHYWMVIFNRWLDHSFKSHPPDAIVRSVRLDVHDPWAVLANSAVTRCTFMQLFHQSIAFCFNKDLFPSFSLPKAAESLSFSFQFFLFSQSFFLRLYSESDWCGWILRRCLNCMQNTCTINTLQYQPMDQKQQLSGHLTIIGHPTKHFLASSSFVRRRLNFQVQYVYIWKMWNMSSSPWIF